MPTQDTSPIKSKILSVMRLRGAALPVHIAKEAGLSILFASAFLSELVADKTLKISNLRVGTSPVYFLPERVHTLEKFAEHLKSKEKDAFLLLKEKQFLIDKAQEPAIRVALRAIKDFAIPFEHENTLIWRYFTIPQENYTSKRETKQETPQETLHAKESLVPQAVKLKIEHDQKKEQKEKLDIFEKPPEKKTQPKEKPKKKTSIKKTTRKKSAKETRQEKFFNLVKEALEKKGIEITGVIGVSDKDLTLKIKKNGAEKLLIAFNKKKFTEADIIKAYKKANELDLHYQLFSLGETPKKMAAYLEAAKALEGIEKI